MKNLVKARWSLLLVALLCLVAGCTEKIGVEQQRYACDDSRECLDGYECLPVDPAQPDRKACRPSGSSVDLDAGDTDDVTQADDATSTDAAPDTAPNDATGQDVAEDAACITDCPQPCAGPSDCAAWQTCSSEVCRPKTCSQNSDCGDTAVCSLLTDQCRPAPFYVKITDTTSSGDSACNDEDIPTPGVDIWEVDVLVDGDVIGYANFVAAKFEGSSNETTANLGEEVLDGEDTRAGVSCPPRVALGCQGFVYLEFFKPNSQEVLLREDIPAGARLRVWADSGSDPCPSNPEPWEASVCYASRQQLEMFETVDCTAQENALGTATINLSF